MKIILEQVGALYDFEVATLEGRATRRIDEISTVVRSMNDASRVMYRGVIGAMLAGAPFYRSINKAAGTYVLDRIARERGPVVLSKAVRSVDAHVDYYETLGKGGLPGLRAISDRFKAGYQPSQVTPGEK